MLKPRAEMLELGKELPELRKKRWSELEKKKTTTAGPLEMGKKEPTGDGERGG